LDLSGVKVYFSPCGIGLGHVGRIIPIAEEMRNRGAEVLISTYLEAVDFVNRRNLPVVRSPALSLKTDSTGRIDMKASALNEGPISVYRFREQVKAEIDYIKAFKPDLVVADTRLSTVIAGKFLRLPVALMLNQFLPMMPRENEYQNLMRLLEGSILTLMSSSWGASDLILIPDFPPPYTLSVDSLRIPPLYINLVRFVGSILPKKPDTVNNSGRVHEEAGVKEGERLIYAAISGPVKERKPLLKLLTPIFREFPEGFRVVMSMGQPDGGPTPTKDGRLTKIPWVTDRFEYLKACDMVISRGGHNTIMQSLCFGKSSLIIPVPNHTEQYANARRAKEMGISEAIHQHEVRRESLVNASYRLLMDPEYRLNIDRINRMGMSNGLENSITEILGLLEE
jgi:UDP:flavonoid glycosyltransferase YjiC (YdhE family)